MYIQRPAIPALAIVLVLSGCGKGADEQATGQVMEQGAGEPAGIDMSDNRLKITTEEGSINIASGGGVAVPDGFPEDIYLHEGAKVMATMTMPQGRMLTLQTADTAAEVADAYQAAMSASGWEREMAMDSPAGKLFSYTKQSRQVQVTIAADSDGDGATITIIAGSGE